MILSERIKEVVKHSGLTIPKFADYVGFATPQTVRELVNGRTKSLSFAVASKILASYPEISETWLKEGSGDMLKPTPQEYYAVGIGIGQQKGGKNDFKIEIKEDSAPENMKEEERIICDLKNEIAHLKQRIADLQVSLERERKMNDYLMAKK